MATNNPSAPLLNDGYNDGDMYGNNIQPSAPQMHQQPYVQPQYQAQPQQTQPMPQQYVQQPQQQTQAPSQYQPTEQQLGEGCSALPIIVSQPEPIRIHGSKDGVGMKEGCRRNPHLLSWIFTISFWYLLFSIAACNVLFHSATDGYCGWFVTNIGIALGITAGVALAYVIECCCAGSAKYLNHILQNEGAQQFVERIKAQPAVINWRVACYHWETRWRTKRVTDSNGNTRTERESYREKVYTWRARDLFRYATCIDVSGQLLGLDEYNLTKLRMHKTWGFANVESQNEYMRQRRMFRMMNWRDVHQEFYEEYSINGYVDRILAESEPGIKPGWMSASCYWLCNALFCSPCFRHKMSAACGNAEYTFIKQLSSL